MKQSVVVLMSSALILSSCGTYTGSGAFAGAHLGTILGSAIGGLSGGPRGSDVGTLVGMVGGTVIGAAIGSAADKQESQEVHDHYTRVQENKARGVNPYASSESTQEATRNYNPDPEYNNQLTGTESATADQSGFDATNSGDDRLYDFQGSDYTGTYSAATPPTTTLPSESSVEDLTSHLDYTPNIEITNARFVDDNEDGALSRGETGKVIFEVRNKGEQTLYDVIPSVIEVNGNTHLYISPSIHVESIAPGRGIRYTAIVKADKKLPNGSARFAVTVLQGNKSISKVTEFDIKTKK